MSEFTHLTKEDEKNGNELNEVIETLDEASKKIILIYASGLRDRQMITESGKSA
ncbi:MAG: hypothetical protein K0R92_556 [Lachnospiraceae bacterium]|jgi:hypothetical protein|nr:hypothetical protein [Lachnospiraceae bacterium]